MFIQSVRLVCLEDDAWTVRPRVGLSRKPPDLGRIAVARRPGSEHVAVRAERSHPGLSMTHAIRSVLIIHDRPHRLRPVLEADFSDVRFTYAADPSAVIPA